jgi:5-dehydro-4-deoxyglucarate dehydratase
MSCNFARKALAPDELRQAIADRVLSFPLTDFDDEDRFNPASYRGRLEWLNGVGAPGHFVVGGAGEFFSLTSAEYGAIVATAVDACRGRVPVIAAAGLGTHLAMAQAQEAELLGADGLLLLPPYLTEAPQAGLAAHIAAVCRATRLGVIIYNRANCRLTAETLARLTEDCPNLIGLKDGIGDIERFLTMRSLIGDRLLYINGMPTAEVYARAYKGMGVKTYSSAIFNFVPRTAMTFHRAVLNDDVAVMDKIFREFFLPYIRIRNNQPGYAVSIVKAGADIVGRGGGRVRSPLSELSGEERGQLAALIQALGPQ